MDMQTKQRMFNAAIDGNRLTLIKFIVTLIDRRDMGNGSGTLVQIGEHLFIATAKHVIPSDPNGRIWPMTRNIRHEADGFPAYKRVGKHPSYDLGYLEVHPEGVTKYFGEREFCTLKNIALRGCGRQNFAVIAVGAPAEHAKITRDDAKTATYKANVMTYWTVPLMPDEWPTVPADAEPASTGVDIFLNYPKEEVTEDGVIPTALPHPGGMSGGGFWDQEMIKGELWDPNAIKLMGIQSRWDEDGRYLRGVQIVHWLRLIYRDFPDLRETLVEAFGDAVIWNEMQPT